MVSGGSHNPTSKAEMINNIYKTEQIDRFITPEVT